MTATDPPVVEVFSDVTCPFAHVGLRRVTEELVARDTGIDVRLLAWPLEWVNGAPLGHAAVAAKAAVLSERLGVESFEGLGRAAWPDTTVPALELTAAAYEIDQATGFAVGMAIRSALFRHGRDISEPDVLVSIAREHGMDGAEVRDARTATLGGRVQVEYEDGRRRGVRGSPHYWAGDTDFFCPALVIGRGDDGGLIADFDPSGLSTFLDAVTGSSE